MHWSNPFFPCLYKIYSNSLGDYIVLNEKTKWSSESSCKKALKNWITLHDPNDYEIHEFKLENPRIIKLKQKQKLK